MKVCEGIACVSCYGYGRSSIGGIMLYLLYCIRLYCTSSLEDSPIVVAGSFAWRIINYLQKAGNVLPSEKKV